MVSATPTSRRPTPPRRPCSAPVGNGVCAGASRARGVRERAEMSWNGCPVIDLDSHIVERPDRFYGEYLDPAYHEVYQRLCDAVAKQAEAGDGFSLFGSRTSI